MTTHRPHVVILGGGFGGVGAARRLKGTAVDVTLVDWHDYHTFHPFLYQVATDLLEPTAVGHPLRDLFHEQANVAVHQAQVTSVDLAARRVRFADMAPLSYDYLVLALGAGAEFFGVEGAAEHAWPLYTLADAVRLRDHVLSTWEAADKDPALAEAGALDVVVVGGGPTGVESAGALSELFRSNFAADYPDLPLDRARIVLVEMGPALLSMFKPDIRDYAKRALEDRQVEVRLGEAVAAIEPTRARLESGTVLDARTVVWCAGLHANPVVRSLGVPLQHGRAPTEPDLSLASHPDVFAVGDVAWTIDTNTNQVLPQLAAVALQAGHHAGHNITRAVAGKPTEPFRYHDRATMATIGRGAGVVQTHQGHTFTGRTAFLAWGAVHLALLSTGGEDRIKAAIDWTWAAFTHERAARISLQEIEPTDD